MAEKHASRPIFRPAAVHHHLRRREEVVFPRWVRPPVFLGLWIGLALLASVAVIAWATRIPAWVRGIALLQSEGGTAVDGTVASGSAPRLFIVLPAKTLPKVDEGSRVFVDVSNERAPFRATVAATEASPIGLETVFPGWKGSAETVLLEARWLPGAAAELPDDLEDGQLFMARIEVGEQPLAALVPVLGRWLEED
jgi:hypothetical protein